MNKGGMHFVIEGECDGFRDGKKNEKTGEIPKTTNITYWGGATYCRLQDHDQAKLVKKGDWVVAQASVREFQDKMYPDAITIVSVNGKAVKDHTGVNVRLVGSVA